MRANTDIGADTGTALKRLSRKDYPGEVEEFWLQEAQLITAGVHMRISGKDGEDWLEPGPEIDAAIVPVQQMPNSP